MPYDQKIHCDFLEDTQFNQSTEKWEQVSVLVFSSAVISFQVEKLWELLMISKESLKHMVQNSYNHIGALDSVDNDNSS